MRPEERLSLCFPGLKTVGGAELETEQPGVGKQKISGRLISLSHWGAESCTLSIGLKGDLFPILPGRREETAGTLAPLGGVRVFLGEGRGGGSLPRSDMAVQGELLGPRPSCLPQQLGGNHVKPLCSFHSYIASRSNTSHLAASPAFHN